jgi:hypothetical protein
MKKAYSDQYLELSPEEGLKTAALDDTGASCSISPILAPHYRYTETKELSFIHWIPKSQRTAVTDRAPEEALKW